MAAVVPSIEQTTELLQKISLDSQSNGIEQEAKKQHGTVDVAKAQTLQYEQSMAPLVQDFMDPSGCYHNSYSSGPYYYSGLDYGYGPYSLYPGTPFQNLGHDFQLYGSQKYQYSTKNLQPLNPTSLPYSPSQTPPLKVEVSSITPTEAEPLERSNGNVPNGEVLKGNNGSSTVKLTHQNSSFNLNDVYQDPKYPFDGMLSQWISSAKNTSSMTDNIHPQFNPMSMYYPRPLSGINPAHEYLNKMYQNKMYGQYENSFRPMYGLPSNFYGARTNCRVWTNVDNKYKSRGRPNGYFSYRKENIDGLNELNCGPRAKGPKNQKDVVSPMEVTADDALITTADEENEKISENLGQYDHLDFNGKYGDAKFFVIKSYSEDDVHKSVKYNVWSSTSNGNKKLDAVYKEALGKSCRCPIFLLFSVNTSGQFVGLAEMVGPVDFDKTVEYWQQDKWNGCFAVKWHIVKDVPNNLLKHITLENNENKPVTNSRDTQEVKFKQGLEVIKVFKECSSKTCILDDFLFYEGREVSILKKKARKQQFAIQIWEGKPAIFDRVLPNTTNNVSESIKSSSTAIQTNGDSTQLVENTIVSNGVIANAC